MSRIGSGRLQDVERFLGSHIHVDTLVSRTIQSEKGVVIVITHGPMSVGVMKDQKLKLRNLHVSHTLDLCVCESVFFILL